MTLANVWSIITKVIDICIVWFMTYYILKNVKNNVKMALIDEPINNLDAKHIIHLSDLCLRIRYYNPEFSIAFITHCHAFPKIDKAYEINNGVMNQIEYQPHNCFGKFDENGFYQDYMNPNKIEKIGAKNE